MWGAYHKMMRVIEFVIYTKAFGLEIAPKIEGEANWKIKYYILWQ